MRFQRVVDVLATRKRRTKLQLAFDRVHEEIAVITSTEVRGKQADVKGKSLLPMFLSIFQNLIEAGHGDLIGRTCDIIRQIKVRVPDLDVTSEALSGRPPCDDPQQERACRSDELEDLARSPAALSQPSSDFYKKFCETMMGRCPRPRAPSRRTAPWKPTSRTPRQR